jgi:hypothetical protein
MKFLELKKSDGPVETLGIEEATRQISKLSQQFRKLDEPTSEELEQICREHDVYQLDRLAQELYGIHELSMHIDKIKTILGMKE